MVARDDKDIRKVILGDGMIIKRRGRDLAVRKMILSADRIVRAVAISGCKHRGRIFLVKGPGLGSYDRELMNMYIVVK